MKSILRIPLVIVCIVPIFGRTAEQTGPLQENLSPQKTTRAIDKVIVNGDKTKYDPERDDTASKTIINRSELLKYGDFNMYDALKRVPGISIGSGGQLMIRGLGGGYTQILINGDRPPPGFRLDTISPSTVERIEVIRAATAEFSNQAIAGTINIVLTQNVSSASYELSAGYGQSAQTKMPGAALNVSDKLGRYSYMLTLAATKTKNNIDATAREEIFGGDATSTLRESNQTNVGDVRAFNVTHRMNWQQSKEQTFSGQIFANVNENDSSNGSYDRLIYGVPSQYPIVESSQNSRTTAFRAEATWTEKLKGAKREIKASVSKRKWNNDQLRLASNDLVTSQLRSDILLNSDTRSAGLVGKFNWETAESQSIAAGWDVSNELLNEFDRRTDEPSSLGYSSAENTKINIRRLALYLQNEWNVNTELSMYAGVRYEAIHTSIQMNGINAKNHSGVMSPLFHILYKIPGQKGKQIRGSVTRTYRAPSAASMSPRRTYALENRLTSPDSVGNPEIKAELATGVDIAFENYVKDNVVFTATGYAKHLRDYIHPEVFLGSDNRWIVRPTNDGTASIYGIDLSARFPIAYFVDTSMPLDARLSLSKNWSSVSRIPPPENRLAQQVPLILNLGFDYRGKSLNGGASFSYQKGGYSRLSILQYNLSQYHRDLDAYLLWKATKKTQVRLSLSNILAEPTIYGEKYITNLTEQISTTTVPKSRTVQLTLEHKF